VIAALATGWIAPSAALAQVEPGLEEADLETLMNTPIEVWTATKTVQKSYEAPAIITTITREQIAVWGYRSVAELLTHVLGFYMVDDHRSPNVAVRGISGGLYADSSIIKVLIDGQSVAFLSTGGNALGPELIPLSAIERVEIIRGPASALYGADAFLGLVNIQTRSGSSVNGLSGSVAGGWTGGQPAADVDLSLGTSRGPVDVLLAYRQTEQNLSDLAIPVTTPGSPPALGEPATTAGPEQATTSALAKVVYRPIATGALTLFAHRLSWDRGLPDGDRVDQWQFRSGLQWDQDIGQSVQLSVVGAYCQGATGDDNRLEVGSEFYFVRRRFGYRCLEGDGHVAWTPLSHLRLVTGASLLVDDEQLPSRIGVVKQPIEGALPGDTLEAISITQGRKTFINAGAYLQGTWDIVTDLLGVTGGLRYDQHNIYGGQLSRRLGLVSSPRPNLHAKLLHGTAFKAPSPLLLYAVPSSSGDVVGNQDLAPQYVNTFEFQLAYDPIEMLSLSTDVAYSVVNDKTEFVQQGINKVARNVARAATLSWESLIEFKYGDWFRSYASLELQRTEQRTGQEGYAAQIIGTAGSIYPRMMIHGGAVTQPPGLPVRAAVLASYIGTRRASGNNILLNAGVYSLPGYVLLGATLATRGFRVLRDPQQEVSFSVTGKNLLGSTGPTPGFDGVDYPLAPRALLLQMDLTL
jgi:outer membrane receptor for ferrienterochelin and colicins